MAFYNSINITRPISVREGKQTAYLSLVNPHHIPNHIRSVIWPTTSSAMNDRIPNMNKPASTLVLESMPQQLRARHVGDDWTGVTSPAERRKRQNRIHKRAYRISYSTYTLFLYSPHSESVAHFGAAEKKRHELLGSQPSLSHPSVAPTGNSSEHIENQVPSQEDDARGTNGAQEILQPEGHLLLPTVESRTAFQTFTQQAYQDYKHGAPRLDHLNIIVRVNVLAAFAHNATLLGFKFRGLSCSNLVSSFTQQRGPDLIETVTLPQGCPDWLHPTPLQMTVRHHPWIDLIPIPRLRDNILRTIQYGTQDNTPLAMDILDVRDMRSEAARLIVWGESWDPDGWEASVPFLRKWGGVLEGCPEMIEATNSWRQKRGERKVAFCFRA